MRKVYNQWKLLLKDRTYLLYLILSALFVIIGNTVFVLGAQYRDEIGNVTTVGDLILNLIPVTNLMPIYLFGPFIILAVFLWYLIVYKPKLLPVVLFAFGLIAFARAFAMQITHLGPPPDNIFIKHPELIKPGFSYLFFKSDLFFSGHVSQSFLPFLFIGRENPFIKWGIFVGCLIVSASVLIMHIHYSIDVFAAFFITYGLYKLANHVFKKVNF